VPGFLGALAAVGTSRRKVNSHQRLTALPAVPLAPNAPLYLACSRSLDRYLTALPAMSLAPESLHSLTRDVFYVARVPAAPFTRRGEDQAAVSDSGYSFSRRHACHYPPSSDCTRRLRRGRQQPLMHRSLLRRASSAMARQEPLTIDACEGFRTSVQDEQGRT
jgi:hypothetical protein